MKNRILFISLAVVLVLSMGLIGCGDDENGIDLPDKPEALVIGRVVDTTGSLAIFDAVAAGPLLREFVEYVNNVTSPGGVHLDAYDVAGPPEVLCYVPLELDPREFDPMDWGTLGDLTRDIIDDIDDGDVHFLFGGPGTDCIYTQAPIANAANVVLLTFEGGATGISNDPNKLPVWPYVFITLSYSDWNQMAVLAAMLEDDLGKAPGAVKAYVLRIEGEHGDEYYASCNATFDVIADVEIPFIPGDYGPLVGGVMDTAIAALGTPESPNYDIFCCFAYPDHVMMTTGTAMAKGFDPPAMIFGPGANFGFYAYSFPETPNPCFVNGVMSFTIASYAAKAEITAVYDAIAARMDDDAGDPASGIPGLPGILTLDYWGIPLYWAGLEMWLTAVEDVGYVDQQLLRDALAGFEDAPVSTVLADETWFRMYGEPGYGGGNLDYLCHTGEIGQWQSCGTFETVGPVDAGQPVSGLPNYIVTGNYTGAMTGLWTWLP